MSSTLMIRVGGVAAVLAGSLRILSDSYELVFGRVTPGSTGDTVTAAAHATHLPLLVFAIIGVHLLQQRRVDAFGQVCTLLAIFGMMFLFGGAWAQSFLLPAQRAEGSALVDDPGPLAIVGFLAATVLFVLGLLLWGVTILRARVLPAWPAVLLLVGLLGRRVAQAGGGGCAAATERGDRVHRGGHSDPAQPAEGGPSDVAGRQCEGGGDILGRTRTGGSLRASRRNNGRAPARAPYLAWPWPLPGPFSPPPPPRSGLPWSMICRRRETVLLFVTVVPAALVGALLVSRGRGTWSAGSSS